MSKQEILKAAEKEIEELHYNFDFKGESWFLKSLESVNEKEYENLIAAIKGGVLFLYNRKNKLLEEKEVLTTIKMTEELMEKARNIISKKVAKKEMSSENLYRQFLEKGSDSLKRIENYLKTANNEN